MAPSDVGIYVGLRSLNLKGAVRGALPSGLANLTQLEHLSLERCALDEFPSVVGQLHRLTLLNLYDQRRAGRFLETLPDAVLSLRQLRRLYLSEIHTDRLPRLADHFPELEMVGWTEPRKRLGCSATTVFLQDTRALFLGTVEGQDNPWHRYGLANVRRVIDGSTHLRMVQMLHACEMRKGDPMSCVFRKGRHASVSGISFNLGSYAMDIEAWRDWTVTSRPMPEI